MFNAIAYGQDSLTITALSTTLGYGPGQTPPPRLANLLNASAQTLLLPPINPVLPSPPTSLQIVNGVGDGFQMSIRMGTASVAPTITPYSGDTIPAAELTAIAALTAVGNDITLQASAADKKWYKISS